MGIEDADPVDDGIAIYWRQLKAMLIRNVLLKKRERRKTIAEILLPLYSLGILILIKIMIPNPNFPEILQPRGAASLSGSFLQLRNRTVAIVPDTDDIQMFLSKANDLLTPQTAVVQWSFYTSESELLTAYWLRSETVPIAVIFENSPIQGRLRYRIRTNPSLYETPTTGTLYSSPASCRQLANHWSTLLPIEGGTSCPVNQYYYSGFVALQTLMDYTKIMIETKGGVSSLPHIQMEMFPKMAYTGNWLVAFRVIIPLYMVMALSQFITYLLILIVGEKERKIKEGMKMMGLKDSVFWLSWLIIYGIFVWIISLICCVLLFTLNVFQNGTNFVLVFVLVLLYSHTVIMFGFMITPFFDRSRTAGILSNFAVNLTSLLYFLQVFIGGADSSAIWWWCLSLISSSGFALAMDKALVMDLSGEGVNFTNLWVGPGMPFGGSLIMMAVDIFLYGALAYYLDSVVPKEYGVRTPFWYYCGCWRTSTKCPERPQHNGGGGECDMEGMPQGHTEAAIRIVDLYKSFQGCPNAINGINLTIYEGQITAILGHNGAGKTTLFNILTGLTAPSSGTVLIYGNDIRNVTDMDRIRQMTGVCPQHDILFDNLTAREHLEFFAAVKGQEGTAVVARALHDCDLGGVAGEAVKHLSGGQRRKLSIAIALIGSPRIIILDEPTAGVDPLSRRQLWTLLQRQKVGRVILLTTHFMDEADILADRKAVVTHGKIRCCGTSLFLKNKFGVGYHLTLVLSQDDSSDIDICQLVGEHVIGAEKTRRHGRELSFVLPYDSVANFAQLFKVLEDGATELGICSCGVSMTTLEEVFLHLEPLNQTATLSPQLSQMKLNRNSTSYYSLQNDDVPVEVVPRGLQPCTKCQPNHWQIMYALLRLRTLRFIRDLHKLYLMIILPMVLAALGLYLNSIDTNTMKTNARALTGDMYGHHMSIVTCHNDTARHPAIGQFYDMLRTTTDSVDTYNCQFSTLLQMAPLIGALNTHRWRPLNFTLIYNDTAQHSLPVLLNTINTGFYRMVTGNEDALEVLVEPFQQTAQPQQFNLGIFTAASFMGMIFVLVPVSLAIDVVYDREIKAKNQLRVNGLTFGMYFVTYFIVLTALMIVIFGALLVIILLFQIRSLRDWPALATLTILLVLYSPASILFTTAVSYVFDKAESAQSFLPNITTFLGCIPFFFVIFLDMLRIGGAVAFYLHCFFSVTNPMYLPYAIIYYVQRVYLMCQVNFACTDDLNLTDYATNTELIVILIGIVINYPVWFVVLRMCDLLKSGRGLTDDIDQQGCAMVDAPLTEDQDVRTERQKVNQIIDDTCQTQMPVVLVQNLRKDFKRTDLEKSGCFRPDDKSTRTVINSVSLAIDGGEVFGLLGHNGAGKTTLMKILTAEIPPSYGRVLIDGAGPNAAFNSLGYCPQHDALWKNLTVREHLELYAAIRGVPHGELSATVDGYLSALQIDEYADKQTQHCSGGTRRKLSFAAAMIGAPKIVLLDEPSTGMDPRSKRFLWDTILASFTRGRGAILTTHSMEEADALCSRVGIMVCGQLRCLGSTQHLKNLYGGGYTLEIKVAPTNEANDCIAQVRTAIEALFSEANLQETFLDRLIYTIPQNNVKSLAHCFHHLEQVKHELHIEEYSFSQTTLEQVYLKFAQYEDETVGGGGDGTNI